MRLKVCVFVLFVSIVVVGALGIYRELDTEAVVAPTVQASDGRPPEVVRFGTTMIRANDYEAGVSCWMPTTMEAISCIPMAQTRFRYPYSEY